MKLFSKSFGKYRLKKGASQNFSYSLSRIYFQTICKLDDGLGHIFRSVIQIMIRGTENNNMSSLSEQLLSQSSNPPDKDLKNMANRGLA